MHGLLQHTQFNACRAQAGRGATRSQPRLPAPQSSLAVPAGMQHGRQLGLLPLHARDTCALHAPHLLHCACSSCAVQHHQQQQWAACVVVSAQAAHSSPAPAADPQAAAAAPPPQEATAASSSAGSSSTPSSSSGSRFVADAPPVSPKAEAQLSQAQYQEIYDRLIKIFQERPREDWKRLIVFSKQWPQHKQGVFDRWGWG